MRPFRAVLFAFVMLWVSPLVAPQAADAHGPLLAEDPPRKGLPAWVDDWNRLFHPASVLDGQMVVAYYGQPSSTKMGILGEQNIQSTKLQLDATIKTWEAVSDGTKVISAFHLIYATCYPDANVGVLSDATVLRYIEFAAKNNMLVILDHQLGKYSVEAAMKSMLRWLAYPNVHLAIDPEWKTANPGVELGQIRAQDVNLAQQLMNDYLEQNQLPGKRMLILHQFHAKMITNRDAVHADYPLVDLVHHADGFGPPHLKLDTYKFLAGMKNLPVKGFKLFLSKPWKTVGMDIPLLTPAQVMKLIPRPVYISYQ
jgi:hypothetical protein